MSVQLVRLSRKELYDLVWNQPLSRLAPRYNLSDVGLRKVCTKHRVPVPQRGHWQKIAAGKIVRPIPLAAVQHEQEIVLRVAPQADASDSRSSIFKAAIEAEAASPPIVVADRLTRPHAATEAARESLKRKPDEYGAVHSTVLAAFLVRVHPASVSRALRVIDALAKACEARGFELRPGKEGAQYGGQLQVIVDDFAFGISFNERLRREAYQATPAEIERRRRGQYVYTPAYQFTPSGVLSLKIEPVWGSGLQGAWTDTKARNVEVRLAEVMLGLRKLAIWRRADQVQEAARQTRFDEEQCKRATLRASVEAEKRRIEKLEAEAAAWRRAEIIRGYAAARAASGDPNNDPELQQWVAWATDQADRIDPLRPAPPSILDTPEGDMKPLSIWNFPRE